MVEVKRLVVLVMLVALVTGLFLSRVTDTSTSIANTSVPDNEATAGVREVKRGGIAMLLSITMTTAAFPDE